MVEISTKMVKWGWFTIVLLTLKSSIYRSIPIYRSINLYIYISHHVAGSVCGDMYVCMDGWMDVCM